MARSGEQSSFLEGTAQQQGSQWEAASEFEDADLEIGSPKSLLMSPWIAATYSEVL